MEPGDVLQSRNSSGTRGNFGPKPHLDDPAHHYDFGGEMIPQWTFLAVRAWLQGTGARRITSVCSGAYLLAEAGLLDGRRATTRWESSHDLERRYPKIDLDSERIFVRDGPVWTSAGISAGIDLALALIEDDLGPEPAHKAAQQLVVHQRRPGGQLQFDSLVELGGRTGRFVALIDWMREHLAEPLTVEQLAERAAMSPRNFARAFTSETGTTPTKAVERLRLETARMPWDRIEKPYQFIGAKGAMSLANLSTAGRS